MGKRIDDLIGLDDSPIAEPDLRDTVWGKFLGEINDLIESGDYDWAMETLTGIAESVEKRRWVTDGQRQAIKNIEAGLTRRRWGRRYEGRR
jgi:hypothetical protein